MAKGQGGGPKTPEGKAKALANLTPGHIHGKLGRQHVNKYRKAFGDAGLVGILKQYEADDELVSLRDEIEVSKTFTFKALEGIDLKNCEASWEALELLARDYWNGSKDDKVESGREMCNVIRDGAEEWRKIKAAREGLEQTRRLVDTEYKRVREMNLMLGPAQARTLVVAILNSIEAHVEDPAVRASIGADLSRLMFAGDYEQAMSGDGE